MRQPVIRKLAACALAGASLHAIAAPLLAAPVLAQGDQQRDFDIAAQDAASALELFGRQSGKSIMFNPGRVAGIQLPPLKGRQEPLAALQQLLAGSGLTVSVANANSYVVEPGRPGSKAGEFEARQGAVERGSAEWHDREIIVTGTRVKGTPPTSPIITLDQQKIRESGQTNLGEVIRSIPQNFGGGQNPTLPSGFAFTDQNTTSGSAVNLRGLGADASLTLLNGRRLSYGSFNQSVDISAIPIGAIDRIDIVPEGASAIYGSDAVAGVVNVVLKDHIDDFITAGRIGGTQERGGGNHQISVVGGATWNGGGAIATYDFRRDYAVFAHQRSYLENMLRPYTVFPNARQHSIVLSAHQELTEFARLNIDVLYSSRWSEQFANTGTTPNVNTRLADTNLYSISPTLEAALPGDWTAALNGTLSNDASELQTFNTSPQNVEVSRTNYCYCNSAASLEINAEGSLFSLPGGKIRVAIGGGYRANTFWTRYRNLQRDPVGGRRTSHHVYGEIYLPLISPQMTTPLVNRLSLTGALRHENYSDLESATTAKFGTVYSPVEGLEFKASWGESYKAPTIQQQHLLSGGLLFRVLEVYPGDAYPASATALILDGSSGTLEPEKARTWTATVAIRPKKIRGFKLEVSYFHLEYDGRVVAPLVLSNSLTSIIGNPINEGVVTLDPSPEYVRSILNSLDRISYGVGGPFDESNVVAILDSRLANVARQHIQGVDILATYQFELAAGAMLLDSNVSWISSKQWSTRNAPASDLAGTIFNPPHVRSRLQATWKGDDITLSSALNYTGGVKNQRVVPNSKVASMTTIDATAIYDVRASKGLLKDVSVLLSIQNLTNEDPPKTFIHPLAWTYDPTNYSPLGRIFNLSITKKW